MGQSPYIAVALLGTPLLILGLLTSPLSTDPASGLGLLLSATATAYGLVALIIAVVRP